MTFDTDWSEIGHLAERLHDQLAETGGNIWITPVEIDGTEKLAVVRGSGLGKYVLEADTDLEIVDSDTVDAE